MNFVIKELTKRNFIFIYSEHSRTDLQVLSYQTTHCRMGAYIIGVLLGYFLFRTNGKKIPIPKVKKPYTYIVHVYKFN